MHQGDEEERGRVEPGMRPPHHRAGIYGNRTMRGASALPGREWGTEAEVHRQEGMHHREAHHALPYR